MTLSPDQARSTVLAVLGGIAPEADLAGLDPRANLRRALDLDSVDFQNFLIGLAKATGTDIPDRVAPTLVTVEACVRHATGDRRQEARSASDGNASGDPVRHRGGG